MASTTTTASSGVIIFVSLVLQLAVCCGGGVTSRSLMASPPGTAAAPAPAASNPCFNALLNMSDCLTYVEGGSNLTKPDKGCCPELAGLVDSNPICLCQLLGNPDSLGIKIDIKKALKLPSVCRVTTPPVSTCAAVGVPVSLPPSESPMASPPETVVSPAPASNPCFNALLNMSDCLTYVEGGSNLTKPEKRCCPELAGLVESNPICLCQLLGKPDSLGVKIDLNKALKLPSVCRVTTPPISTCSAVGVPVSLPPSESPMASPPETVASPAPASNPCFNALVNMSDCLTYVEGGSNLTKPEKGCCPELAGLVKSNPICLCQLIGKPDSLGIKIDLKKALKLPSVCRVTTPPVSVCSAISPKGSAPSPSKGVPTASPGGDSNSSNEAAANPSGNHDNGNGGIQASSLTFIFGLAIVSVSIFF